MPLAHDGRSAHDPRPERLDAEYVLPLKWASDAGIGELTLYLARLGRALDVTVIDGSPAALFDRHHRLWHGLVRHRPPEPWPGRNGKVAGVVTGVRAARHSRVIIADDDVRWDVEGLQRALILLDSADLVRPQNYFRTLPWHARWDTGRTLVNRALGSDYPGTYGIRRDTFLRMGGYDGDALFENLELARTVRAAGGHEVCVDDLFVARRPPGFGHFLRQRVRQAYDDLSQPVRLLLEAAVLPAGVLLVELGRLRAGWAGATVLTSAAALVVVAVAERGRRRSGGTTVFSHEAALWAPLWLAERAVCVWFALGGRLRGGVKYGGQRLPLAAHRPRQLRRRLQRRAPLLPLADD